MFSFKKFFHSLSCALRGLEHAFKEEQNFRIQVVIALAVLALMVYLGVTRLEKIILLLTILLVLSLELINTTAEDIIDVVEPNHRSKVQVIKDTMAAAVVIAAFGALIIGLVIFLPYLLK